MPPLPLLDPEYDPELLDVEHEPVEDKDDEVAFDLHIERLPEDREEPGAEETDDLDVKRFSATGHSFSKRALLSSCSGCVVCCLPRPTTSGVGAIADVVECLRRADSESDGASTADAASQEELTEEARMVSTSNSRACARSAGQQKSPTFSWTNVMLFDQTGGR